MSAATPTTERQARSVQLASRALAEALSMAGADHPEAGRSGGRSRGELAADALRAHSALSARLGRSVPVTAMGPGGGGVHGLAAFLAVYAGQCEPAGARDLGTAA